MKWTEKSQLQDNCSEQTWYFLCVIDSFFMIFIVIENDQKLSNLLLKLEFYLKMARWRLILIKRFLPIFCDFSMKNFLEVPISLRKLALKYFEFRAQHEK